MDPLRIKRILNKFETFWTANPDLPFLVLVSAVLMDIKDESQLTDEYFEALIEEALRQMGLNSGWKS